MSPKEWWVADALVRIRAEYMEMPGLRLTPAQAERLCGFDRATCELALRALAAARFLSRTRDGAYVRFDLESPSAPPVGYAEV